MIVVLNKSDLIEEAKREAQISKVYQLNRVIMLNDFIIIVNLFGIQVTKRILKTLEATRFKDSVVLSVAAKPGGLEVSGINNYVHHNCILYEINISICFVGFRCCFSYYYWCWSLNTGHCSVMSIWSCTASRWIHSLEYTRCQVNYLISSVLVCRCLVIICLCLCVQPKVPSYALLITALRLEARVL